MTQTIEVFDPAMCCTTGVCGPSVDPALSRFAADLSWLTEQGVEVQRHNLSQEPGAFAANEVVRGLLAERGEGALPTVLVDGAVRTAGRYPSRSELAEWAKVPARSLDGVGLMPDQGCCGGGTVTDEAAAHSVTPVGSSDSGCCG